MSPQTRSDIRRLLSEHDLQPLRHLGQHFLADANITRKIVSVAGVGSGHRVVEIGAGTGTLTLALLEAGARVVAYEVDERLRPILESVVGSHDVDLRFEDVMQVDLSKALDRGQWTMVANLPYKVGTPLLIDTMRSVPQVTRFVVMVQREVAERFVARPGTPEYGIPSVVGGIHTKAELAFRIPPQVFYPAPQVESAVVLMTRRPPPPLADEAIELAKAGFGQRRKMLRRSLAPILQEPAESLERAGLDTTCRAEELSPEDYVRLAGVAS